MALPRPHAAVRAAGLCEGVQADHPGAALVSDPAFADLRDVHRGVQQFRRHTHRRHTAHAVLPGGDHALELLRRMPEKDLQYLRRTQRTFREGLFPAGGDAALDRDHQPDHLRHPVGPLFGLLCLLPAPGRAHRTEWVHPALPLAGLAAGHDGAGVRPPDHLPDDALPRPDLPGAVRRATGHVRHTRHLSAERSAGGIPVDRPVESHDAHHRDLQIRVPGAGHLQLGLAGLCGLVRFRYFAAGHGHFQPHGEIFHGYGVNIQNINFDGYQLFQ